MKHNLTDGFIKKRLAVYALGVIAMSFGISLVIKAGLGVAPGGVISYAISRLTVISVGWCTTLFHTTCILAQLLISGRLNAGLVVQLPLTLVFGQLIDLFLQLLSLGSISLVNSIAMLCVGIITFSLGIRTMAGANLLLMPSDNLAQAAGEKLGWKFPKAKLIGDILFTIIAIALMLMFSGDVFSVIGVGTILSAAVTGPMVGIFTKLLPFLDVPQPGK